MHKSIDVRLDEASPDESAQLFQSGAQSSTFFWTTDNRLRITSLQGEGLAALNLRPGELRGVSVLDCFPIQRASLPLTAAHRRALKGESASLEAVWGDRTFDMRLEPLRNGDGKIRGTIGVALEVFHRKGTEEELPASEQRFRALVENSSDMMTLVSADGTVLYASPSTLRILGCPPVEVVGRSVFELIHPDDHDPAINPLLAELLAKPGGVVTAECGVRAQDGSWRWIEAAGNNLLAEPHVRAVVINYRDITERKRAEALLAGEESILEMLTGGVARSDVLDDLCRAIEEQAPGLLCSVLLLDPDGVRLRHGAAPSLPESYNRAVDGIAIGPCAGSCGTAVYRRELVVVADIASDPLWADFRDLGLSHGLRACWSTPIFSSGNKVLGAFAMYYREPCRPSAEDLKVIERATHLAGMIIERKQAEEALRRAEEKYRSIVENAVEGIFQTTPKGGYVSVNPALARMYGYDSPEQLMASVTDIGHQVYVDPNSRTGFKLLMEQNGFVQGFEYQVYRRDGKKIWLSENARAVRDANGTILYYEGTVEDITERKHLEDMLRQSQKMEGIGRLAGGVAHDFNNLLMVIRGHTELLLDRGSADDWHDHKVEQIQKAADRAAALTRQLLAFSRMQVLQPKVLDLNAVVAEMGKMLPRLIGEDIELIIMLGPKLGGVKADLGQIEQVILNLAVNARDAMPRGGKLIIETANAELDESYARRHPPLVAGRYVMLAVTDTGTGMEAETQAHIFEPFFTTKEPGKGTGLGLATIYGVVKQSDGYVWVYSEPGKGTTFKIYLPWVNEPVQSQQAARRPAEHAQGFETILLVEDEQNVREVAREFLDLSGYTVLEAENGAQAVEIARNHPGPIHVLVSDMVMPGMGGRQLAKRLMALRPEMKVVFMSGYTEYATVRQGELDQDTVLLTKPFTRALLARTVREVLHGGKI